MKKYKTYPLWLIVLFMIVISCRREDFPKPAAATLLTKSVSNITGSTATGGGQIISIGGNKVSTRGICWGTKENPTLSDNFVKDSLNSENFICQMSGLIGGTTYYVRAFATNNGGIVFGTNMSFKTKVVPYLTTNIVTAITGTSATGGGVITNSFGAQITSRGICWSTSVNPSINDAKTTDASGGNSFTSSMTNLLPSTTYHVRAYAATSEGETGYGNDMVFDTKITDYDGNIYTSVKIGTQVWMVQNFHCTHFTDGSPIASVTYHPNDVTPTKEYGAYYAWTDIVKTNFVPRGWHVATDDEWRALYNYVGTNGLSIKEPGTNHWKTANGTNQTGFTAWGGGISFLGLLKEYATWWTSSENSPKDGLRWYLLDDGTLGRTANDKGMVFSVRLIKN